MPAAFVKILPDLIADSEGKGYVRQKRASGPKELGQKKTDVFRKGSGPQLEGWGEKGGRR